MFFDKSGNMGDDCILTLENKFAGRRKNPDEGFPSISSKNHTQESISLRSHDPHIFPLSDSLPSHLFASMTGRKRLQLCQICQSLYFF